MKTFIANFGRENVYWPECLKRSTITVQDGITVHPYWLKNDRDGYIAEAQRVYRSREKRPVITPVASRWFNLNTIFMATAGDIWIHREKEDLWWTVSSNEAAVGEIIEDQHPFGGFKTVYIYHKKCLPWSCTNKKGARLQWRAIHPKARDFLLTEGTFQQLAGDNALYATALINGTSLDQWESRPNWQAKQDRSGKGSVKIFTPLERSAAYMADTAWNTAKQSGQISIVEKKDKQVLFPSKIDLEKYIIELLEDQEGICALTGLEMLHQGVDGDHELHCSLDRIDSNGHYEKGNLQVVCKFANRWKSASDNEEFKRLIETVRKIGNE
jgi:hypothetical protein